LRIVIIGTGNVATVLGKKFLVAAHDIVQVYGRNKAHAEALADLLHTGYTTSLSQLDHTGNLYVLAVSDSAIPAMAAELQLDKKLVVHTAGSVSKNVLAPCSKNFGILYPLQSLRREMQALPEIPFLVDGNTEENLTLIADIAASFSNQVQQADDDQRLKLHVAAVVVSNFTNHLYTLARRYCLSENTDFQLLLPLIQAIAGRLHQFAPEEVQTGPAIRNDEPTIQKHLALLQQHPALQELYGWFTKNIQDTYL